MGENEEAPGVLREAVGAVVGVFNPDRLSEQRGGEADIPFAPVLRVSARGFKVVKSDGKRRAAQPARARLTDDKFNRSVDQPGVGVQGARGARCRCEGRRANGADVIGAG